MISSSAIRLHRRRYSYLGQGLKNTANEVDASSPQETGIRWGVRQCSAHTLEFDQYPFNEFIHLLQGTVDITAQDGKAHRFVCGDSFIIPCGLACTWTSTMDTRKFYVLSEKPTPLNRFHLERTIAKCYQQHEALSCPVKNIC